MARVLLTRHRLSGLFHLLVNGASLGQISVGVEADLSDDAVTALKHSDPDCVFQVLPTAEEEQFTKAVDAVKFLHSLPTEVRHKAMDQVFAQEDEAQAQAQDPSPAAPAAEGDPTAAGSQTGTAASQTAQAGAPPPPAPLSAGDEGNETPPASSPTPTAPGPEPTAQA